MGLAVTAEGPNKFVAEETGATAVPKTLVGAPPNKVVVDDVVVGVPKMDEVGCAGGAPMELPKTLDVVGEPNIELVAGAEPEVNGATARAEPKVDGATAGAKPKVDGAATGAEPKVDGVAPNRDCVVGTLAG